MVGARLLLVTEEVEDAGDEEGCGVVDHGVTVVVADGVAGGYGWEIAEDVGRNRLQVGDVLAGEVAADEEVMTPVAVEAGHVAVEIATEPEAVAAVAEVVMRTVHGPGWWPVGLGPLRRTVVIVGRALAVAGLGAGTVPWLRGRRRLGLASAGTLTARALAAGTLALTGLASSRTLTLIRTTGPAGPVVLPGEGRSCR